MNNEQNVEGLNVSPAIAKPMLCVCGGCLAGTLIENGLETKRKKRDGKFFK